MALVKYRPARHVRLFNSPDYFLRPSSKYSGEAIDWNPRVDVVEKKDEFIVRAELPGIEKKGIEILFKDDVLKISGEKKRSDEVDKDSLFFAERAYGKFERSFRFRVQVEDEKIKAAFKNGVLTVSIPKVPEAEPVKIDVK